MVSSLFYLQGGIYMNETKIKVLKVEPMKHPEEVTLNNTLRALQAAVGGLIEIINLEDDVYLLCNEEGKLIDLLGNRRVGDDIIVGTFYICGGNEEGDLCSLPADKMNYYEKMFYEPEEFQKQEVQAKCILRFISID